MDIAGELTSQPPERLNWPEVQVSHSLDFLTWLLPSAGLAMRGRLIGNIIGGMGCCAAHPQHPFITPATCCAALFINLHSATQQPDTGSDECLRCRRASAEAWLPKHHTTRGTLPTPMSGTLDPSSSILPAAPLDPVILGTRAGDSCQITTYCMTISVRNTCRLNPSLSSTIAIMAVIIASASAIAIATAGDSTLPSSIATCTPPLRIHLTEPSSAAVAWAV